MAKNQELENEVVVDEAAEAAKAERKAKRDAQKAIVADYLKENANVLDDKVVAAIQFFCGGGKRQSRSGGSRNGLSSKLKELFMTGEPVSEMDIFKAFKIGRPETHAHIRSFIKNVKNVDDRIWVAFDNETETYSLVAVGAEVPEGWEGYVPANTEIL